MENWKGEGTEKREETRRGRGKGDAYSEFTRSPVPCFQLKMSLCVR